MGKTYEDKVKKVLDKSDKMSKIDKASKTYDKKLKKYMGSKETQLHADSFEKGNERAEARAGQETMQEYKKMVKGGRAGYKSGGRGCKLAMKGKGRAYGKNS